MIQTIKTWLVIPALILALLPWHVNSVQASESPQQNNIVTIGTASVAQGASGSVDISLNNNDAVASAQIEISYDNGNGVTLTGVSATGRATGFQTNFSENTAGATTTVTILMFNLTGSTIAAGNGAVLALGFTTDVTATGTTALVADTVLLSDSSGGALSASGVDGAITITGTEPDITLVSPNRGTQGETLAVQITGSNVDWNTNAPTNVSFGAGVTVSSHSVVNATTLSAAISIGAAATTGPRDVTVTAGVDTATESNGFTVQGPGIGVFIPTDAVSSPGGSFTVPVSVTNDVTGEGILAYGFTLTFSPTIRLQSVSQVGTLSDNNWSVSLNRENGEARIVGFSSVAMAGSGTLIDLTFDVSPSAEIGEEVDIVFSEFRFNEGEPASQTTDGKVTIMMEPATISGCVTPMHDFSQVVVGLPISFTNMFSGAQDTVVETDDDGCYSVSLASGDYVATPARTGDIGNSLNVWDSVQIALHDVQQDESNFSTHQLTVCDVTQDGTCTGFDAAQIALYRIDPALTDSLAGQFISAPFSRTHSLGGGDSQANQDYEVYLAGDVTFDWPASVQGLAVFAAARTQSIVVTLPSVTTIAGGGVNLPVTVANAGQKGMLGYELFIRFNPEVLTIELEGVNHEGSVNQDNGWAFERGIINDSEIRVVSYGTSQLESDGVLFNIVATAKSNFEGQTPLTVSHLMFNDGQPATEGVNGQVDVAPIASQSYLPVVAR